MNRAGPTFPFGTTTIRINICLNESNVTLYDRSNILDPSDGSLFVFSDRTCLKAVWGSIPDGCQREESYDLM